jgi:hypothetical protein
MALQIEGYTIATCSRRRGSGLYFSKQIVSLAALLCGLQACAKGPNVNTKQPDRILFERAISAVEQKRFDIAKIDFQTLVNTYPDSDYARKARVALTDPRIANCGEWNSPQECDGQRVKAPPAK